MALPPPPPRGYERSAVPGATVDDLDRDALAQYVARRWPQPVEDVLPIAERMGLLTKMGQHLVPSVLGLLLFGHYPQMLHPHWAVSAVRIDGHHLTDPVVAQDVLEGPFAALIEQSFAFVETHSRMVASDSASLSEYPSRAVHEALVNALIHRDLRSPGRVTIRLFDNRLEVWSPGGPAAPVERLDELLLNGGISVPRNPLLANASRILGFGEQLGRGLPTMRRQLAEQLSAELGVHGSRSDVLLVIPSGLTAPATLA